MNPMQDKRKLALALVVMFSTYSTLFLPLQGAHMKQCGRLCKVGGGLGSWCLVREYLNTRGKGKADLTQKFAEAALPLVASYRLIVEIKNYEVFNSIAIGRREDDDKAAVIFKPETSGRKICLDYSQWVGSAARDEQDEKEC
jgi:hypothetical protein